MKDREIFEKETGIKRPNTFNYASLEWSDYWKAYATWLEKRSEWVSVEDRLPTYDKEASKDVIAAIIENGEIKRWSRANVGNNGSWYKDGLCLFFVPTHWCDLPTPPNEAKRG